MITSTTELNSPQKMTKFDQGRQLKLVEWEPLDIVLSPAEVSSLLRCPPSVLQVQTLPDGACRLRPGPIIGRLRLGSIDLRILPKYPMPSLLAMLVEVHELAKLTPDLVGYDTSPDVVDLLVQIFLGQTEGVVRQGLKRTYLQRDEELVAVRGRLDARRTVELHLRGHAKVQCRHEEYTLDGPENGTLLGALHAIQESRVLPVIRRNLAHRMATEFVGVTQRVPDTSKSRHVEYDRLNQHYYPALQLAELILHSMGVTQEFGSAEADGFLLNMNQLFERFVHRKLQKLLTPDGVQVRVQKKSPFDVQKQAEIQPDLLIQGRHGRRVVGDTKYKIGTTAEPGDLYQMLTYCRVLNVANGILITAGTGERRTYDVLDGATTIEVIPVDLGGTVTAIDRSLTIVANRIRELLQIAS